MVRRIGKTLVVLSALLCCCACSVGGKKQGGAVAVDAHTSMNALDWAGTYTGTMPCADCAGIETTLTLTPARTYVLHHRYLGRQEGGNEFNYSGVFEWSQDGRSIELHGLAGGRALFQVGENRLFALDQGGARIEGVLEEAYTLTRSGAIRAGDLSAAVNVFAGTAWHLVELEGEPLAPQEAAAWLVFEVEPARVHGFSGCNRFFGAYQAGDAVPQRVVGTALPLKFDSMGVTMMACPPPVMEYETRFLAMLEQVAGVYIEHKAGPENKTERENTTKPQNWWEGSVLVFVDSSHRVIARFGADAEM
ncbi:MAG: copper resistance protein NlpE N-terminal domain-containing protein [Desulfuromonas sp.]